MPSKPSTFRPAHAPTRKENRRRYDRARAERHAWRAWYKTKRWLDIRARQLTDEPLCRMCAGKGLIVPATVCDHVDPHRGDPYKFWHGPKQSLCEPCHNSAKQREEAVGSDEIPG